MGSTVASDPGYTPCYLQRNQIVSLLTKSAAGGDLPTTAHELRQHSMVACIWQKEGELNSFVDARI
jgi:hypothetical protein